MILGQLRIRERQITSAALAGMELYFISRLTIQLDCENPSWGPCQGHVGSVSKYHCTFTFQKRSTLETVSADFSYPKTLLPDWSNAIHPERRTYHGNADWRHTLLMCSVQSLLRDDQRPQNTYATAWWKEATQLLPVWLLKHRSCDAEKTHACSQRR